MRSASSKRSPLVSIIIPCYNAEGSIGEAIETACRQTYTNTEIIVIDDGSTDGSLDVVRTFGDAIRWKSQPNSGGGSARNSGLALCRGEFVQFLDADDLLSPECVSRKLTSAMAQPGTSPCSDWTCIETNGAVTIEQPALDASDPVIAVLLTRIAISSPLHRVADLRRIEGFTPGLPCSQDRDLHLRLACAGVRFVRLCEPLFTVRRRRTSVSSDLSKVLVQRSRLLARIADDLDRRNELTRARRFAFARVLAADARRLFHRGMMLEARRNWEKASALDRAGLDAAYGRRSTRRLLKLIGPERAESVITAFRSAMATVSNRQSVVR